MSLAMEKLALLAETEPAARPLWHCMLGDSWSARGFRLEVTVAALIPTADLGYSVVSVAAQLLCWPASGFEYTDGGVSTSVGFRLGRRVAQVGTFVLYILGKLLHVELPL